MDKIRGQISLGEVWQRLAAQKPEIFERIMFEVTSLVDEEKDSFEFLEREARKLGAMKDGETLSRRTNAPFDARIPSPF